VNPSGDWTLAASIMTFAIPVGLFVIVATILYFLYTRPHAVPGHRELAPAGAAARLAAPAPGAAAPEASTQDATTEGPATEGSEGTE
jgi:hypothetical protein